MKKRNSSVNKTIHNFYLSKLKNPKIKKLYSRFKRIISKDINKVLKLSFRSKGKDVEIGSFLNDEEKVELKENISKIIEDLNANP